MTQRRLSRTSTALAILLAIPPFLPAQNIAAPTLPNNPAPSLAPNSLLTPFAAQPAVSTRASTAPQPTPDPHITIPENTLIRVMSNTPLSTAKTHAGAALEFTLSEDILVGQTLIIPRGATVHGTAVRSKQAGKLKGSAELIFELTSIDLGGHTYPVYTYQFKVEGESKENSAENITGSAFYGALAGSVALGQKVELPTAVQEVAAMGAGAAVGAGVGTLASLATPVPPVSLPAEAQMDFHLASPISVIPATPQEAARLQQQLHPGGPVLFVRGDTP